MLEHHSLNSGERFTPTGLQDKIENAVEVLKGKAKEAAGKASGTSGWCVRGSSTRAKATSSRLVARPRMP